jgi:mannose-6-phosphate isomerase-like protein (cupin superfamily)
MCRFCAVFVVAVALGFTQTKADEPVKSQAAVVLTSEEIWSADPTTGKPPSSKVVWMAPDKSSRDLFMKWAGGKGEVTEAKPVYTHNFDFRVVVLRGTAVLELEETGSKELGPGSYLMVPANVKHRLFCKAGPECILFSGFSGIVKP